MRSKQSMRMGCEIHHGQRIPPPVPPPKIKRELGGRRGEGVQGLPAHHSLWVGCRGFAAQGGVLQQYDDMIH